VDNDAIVWDSSLRCSARTFIRMMTMITTIVFANGLPETRKIRRLKSCFNNAILDEMESSVGQVKRFV
jgi:hypothetical protein